MVNNPPAMQQSRVLSLVHEDPLETRMATHSSILAWRIPQTEEPDRLLSMESQRVEHDLGTNNNSNDGPESNWKRRGGLTASLAGRSGRPHCASDPRPKTELGRRGQPSVAKVRGSPDHGGSKS